MPTRPRITFHTQPHSGRRSMRPHRSRLRISDDPLDNSPTPNRWGWLHGNIRGVELHPQLRESRRGHVRRNRSLFRHGSKGSRAGRLSVGISRRIRGPRSNIRGFKGAPALSGGSLYRPSRPIQNFPHDGSQVFYNREDLWAAPIETYAGETQA